MENNQELTTEKTLTSKEQKQALKQAEKERKAQEKEKLKKKKAKAKKEKGPNKLVKKTKELGSELKKVTWPSFKTVVKSTGVIIAVVLVFTVALFGIDTVLGLIFKAFTKSL